MQLIANNTRYHRAYIPDQPKRRGGDCIEHRL